MTKTQEKEDQARHKAMKEKHPEIEHVLEVEGRLFGYLKKIERATMEIALGKLQKVGQDAEYIYAGELILRNCWVAGDNEILDNEDNLMTAALQCNALIELKQASLKKI